MKNQFVCEIVHENTFAGISTPLKTNYDNHGAMKWSISDAMKN